MASPVDCVLTQRGDVARIGSSTREMYFWLLQNEILSVGLEIENPRDAMIFSTPQNVVK